MDKRVQTCTNSKSKEQMFFQGGRKNASSCPHPLRETLRGVVTIAIPIMIVTRTSRLVCVYFLYYVCPFSIISTLLYCQSLLSKLSVVAHSQLLTANPTTRHSAIYLTCYYCNEMYNNYICNKMSRIQIYMTLCMLTHIPVPIGTHFTACTLKVKVVSLEHVHKPCSRGQRVEWC